MRKKRNSIEAFSLIEVTLALAIVVFCMVIVFGLLAVGVTASESSISQTTASQVLSAISADIQSTPKTVAATNSAIYGIALPATSVTGSVVVTSPAPTSPLYIQEDGTTNTAVSGARYRLFVWTTSAETTTAPATQETLVRLILSWPAGATNYTTAQGYVEGVVAVNRTP